MTKTDHLAKAKDYIAKGEGYYRKAAEEIVAARKENPSLTYDEIAESLGRSDYWCRQLVQWSTNPMARTDTPFARDDWDKRTEQQARKVLREADQATLGEIVDALPRDRREALGRTLRRAELADSPPPLVQDDGAARAVETSLNVQVASLLAQVAVVDVLLREGRGFTNVDARKAERLQRDIERAIDTLGELRDRVPVPGVRAVA